MKSILGKKVDEFRFLDVLGQGGMGVVYRAEDTNLDRLVAIKMIDTRLTEDEAFLRRFRSEAKALAKLNHLNIVGIYNLRDSKHGLMMIMEYIEGKTLAQILAAHGPIYWEKALPIFEQLLTAIFEAHKVKVIHRDIKPSNVMLTVTKTVKVTDFGLAKIQKVGDETLSLPTGGTLYYMAPEQIQGQTHIDRRTDIYALGMTLYEVLAGRTPFDKTWSDFTIQKAIVEEQFPSPSHYNPQVPKAIADVIIHAIEKEPEDRFQSVKEMKEALRQAAKQPNLKTTSIPFVDYTSSHTEPVIERKKAAATPSKGAPKKPAQTARWKNSTLLYVIAAIPLVAILAYGAHYFFFQQTSPPVEQQRARESALQNHSPVIREIASIADADVAKQRLHRYSSDMLLAFGTAEDFEPLDGCYVLLYRDRQVSGFFQFREGVFNEVKTGNSRASIGALLAASTAIWIQDFSPENQNKHK